MINATQTRGKVGRSSSTLLSLDAKSLAFLLRYENEGVVYKLMQEYKYSHDDAYDLFKDMLRFLWLAHFTGKLVPTKRIDKAWHAFILFTMDYQKFCHKYFGQFIHHRPNRPGVVHNTEEATARTIELIREHLGENLGKNWQFRQTVGSRCSGHDKCCKECCTH